MRSKLTAFSLAVLASVLLVNAAPAQSTAPTTRPVGPGRWEERIAAFEAHDRAAPPPQDAVLFAGSSSIVGWKLGEFFPGMPSINRGFGGSEISDSLHFMDRIVLPYRPRAIVFYAGENDMAGVLWSSKKTPEQVRDAFRAFCKKIFASAPDTPIYFISIKPPKRRIAEWPQMRAANRLIRDYCASDQRLHYIDIVPPMSDPQGNPRGDLYSWDGIHMNAQGYAIWTSAVKPALVKAATLPRFNEVARAAEL